METKIMNMDIVNKNSKITSQIIRLKLFFICFLIAHSLPAEKIATLIKIVPNMISYNKMGNTVICDTLIKQKIKKHNRSFTLGYKHCGITFGNPDKCNGICFGNPEICNGIRVSLFSKLRGYWREPNPNNPDYMEWKIIYPVIKGLNILLFDFKSDPVILGLNLSILNLNEDCSFTKGITINLLSSSGFATVELLDLLECGIINTSRNNYMQIGIVNYAGKNNDAAQLGILNYGFGCPSWKIGLINLHKKQKLSYRLRQGDPGPP